jgi:hypothetical protein
MRTSRITIRTDRRAPALRARLAGDLSQSRQKNKTPIVSSGSPSPTPPAMAMAMGKKKTQMLRTFRSHLNLSLMDCARTYGPRGSEIGPRTADTPHTTRARARACGAVWEEGAPRCPRASRIPARLWDAPYTLQIAHNNERTMLRRGRKRVQRHSETQW